MDIKLLSLRTNKSESGSLSVIEAERDIPFLIKRVYYIHGENKGAHRGFHAHRTLNQLLFCPYGEIEIFLDDGKEKQAVILDSPDKGLFVFKNTWREMIWRLDNSVLCVLASDYYDEADYIRNYNEFLAYLNRNGAD